MPLEYRNTVLCDLTQVIRLSNTSWGKCCVCSAMLWGFHRSIYREDLSNASQTHDTTQKSQLFRTRLSSPPASAPARIRDTPLRSAMYIFWTEKTGGLREKRGWSEYYFNVQLKKTGSWVQCYFDMYHYLQSTETALPPAAASPSTTMSPARLQKLLPTAQVPIWSSINRISQTPQDTPRGPASMTWWVRAVLTTRKEPIQY